MAVPWLCPAIRRARYQRGHLVERKHATSEEGLRPFRPAEPCLKLIALFANGFRTRSTNFCDCQRADVEIVVVLLLHPGEQLAPKASTFVMLPMMLYSSR